VYEIHASATSRPTPGSVKSRFGEHSPVPIQSACPKE